MKCSSMKVAAIARFKALNHLTLSNPYLTSRIKVFGVQIPGVSKYDMILLHIILFEPKG